MKNLTTLLVSELGSEQAQQINGGVWYSPGPSVTNLMFRLFFAIAEAFNSEEIPDNVQ